MDIFHSSISLNEIQMNHVVAFDTSLYLVSTSFLTVDQYICHDCFYGFVLLTNSSFVLSNSIFLNEESSYNDFEGDSSFIYATTNPLFFMLENDTFINLDTRGNGGVLILILCFKFNKNK